MQQEAGVNCHVRWVVEHVAEILQSASQTSFQQRPVQSRFFLYATQQ